MKHLSVLASLAFNGAALTLAVGASAEERQNPYWEFGLGAAGLHYPDYLGSDEYNSLLAPFPYFYYTSERLSVDRNAVRGKLFQRDRLTLDVSLSGAIPVDSDDNDARAGMPDLRPILEIGPSLKFDLYRDPRQRVTFELPVRAAIASTIKNTRYLGLTSNPNLSYQRKEKLFGAATTVTASLGPMFSEQRYHDYFYSVANDFANAERPRFDADGGFGGWRLSAGFSQSRGNLWYGAFLRYFDLADAEYRASPLVRETDAFTAGFAIAWIFLRSD